jgi:hypothetical protein
MIKQCVIISLIAYFLFGSLCLPYGDFSYLTELPEMYRHCKATEDVDMGPIDFLTDHLINVDGAFDKHNNGDQQKPHQSNQTFRANPILSLFIYYPTVTIISPVSQKSDRGVFCECLYSFNYISSVFHPPTVLS